MYFIVACHGVNFICRNKECVYYSYVCDGENDCGCTGSGCDEESCGGLNWCKYMMSGSDLMKMVVEG